MKPLLSKPQDSNSLQTLGRASVQIVHDLKNQLNGLKLYATFLRKRMEKGVPAPDEMETINKLIAGLDRAAAICRRWWSMADRLSCENSSELMCKS